MTNPASEPTLTDVLQKLEAMERRIDQRLEAIEKRLDTLDSRLFDFSMRIVTTNQSAFWSISIALLSAVIAYAVARIGGGNL